MFKRSLGVTIGYSTTNTLLDTTKIARDCKVMSAA
jgi:hypothetical protein